MGVNIKGRSYLKLLDYTSEEIRYLLDLSKQFKNMKRNSSSPLSKKKHDSANMKMRCSGWTMQ